MQRMMQDPEPVIVTGGTADTRDLLPRMRFQIPAHGEPLRHCCSARSAPPTRSRADAAAARGRPRSPSRSPPAVRAARARRAARLRASRRTAKLGEEALAIDPRPGGRGSGADLDGRVLAWLAAGSPGFGHYLPLEFRSGEALVGWALLRSYDGPSGREAALLDVRAREPSERSTPGWSPRSRVRAAGLGAGLLLGRHAVAHVEAALRAQPLPHARAGPIHYWSQRRRALEAPVVFGSHWGDEPLVPYPDERAGPEPRRRGADGSAVR